MNLQFIHFIGSVCFFFKKHLLLFKQVMRDPSGVSKGSGFVAFSTPEEASRAVC